MAIDNRFGYQNTSGTGFDDELLASNIYQTQSITIDNTARDTANTTNTDLRKGLMLVPSAGVGDRYIQLAAGSAGAATVVVLAENVFGINNGNVVAKAYFAGSFKKNVLLDDSGRTLTHFTAANCQRIAIRNE